MQRCGVSAARVYDRAVDEHNLEGITDDAPLEQAGA
jgi:hypothetical protein